MGPISKERPRPLRARLYESAERREEKYLVVLVPS